MDWNKLKPQETVDKTIEALKGNGIEAVSVETQEDAVTEVLASIPEGSEVLTTSSDTIDSIGLSKIINESGKYDSVKNKLISLNRETDNREMQRIGAAPEFILGSVHAVTEDGRVIVASNSGSQIPGYSYGSDHVIWVVSNKKIVKDLDQAMKRIEEHVLPLESVRVRKAYGMERSNISKLLIINKEIRQPRLRLIFVNENLGF